MKKPIYLFATILFLLSALRLSANDYKYLILQTQDGGKKGLSIDGLKFTFAGGSLIATQNGTTSNFDLSALSKMFFKQDLTAIQTVEASRKAVSLQGSKIILNAAPGTVAHIYNESGTLIMSTKIDNDGSPAQISLLKQGIYLVKAGSETHKFLIK